MLSDNMGFCDICICVHMYMCTYICSIMHMCVIMYVFKYAHVQTHKSLFNNIQFVGNGLFHNYFVKQPISNELFGLTENCNIEDFVLHIKTHEEHPNKFYIFSYYYIHCCELIFDPNTMLSDNSTTENINIDVKIECTEQALETVE